MKTYVIKVTTHSNYSGKWVVNAFSEKDALVSFFSQYRTNGDDFPTGVLELIKIERVNTCSQAEEYDPEDV
jgi:hypothetical protein